MAKIAYRQMAAPRELSQQIPTPGQKLRCKSPRVGANFWCKSGGARGVVMDEIYTCIISSKEERGFPYVGVGDVSSLTLKGPRGRIHLRLGFPPNVQ